VTKTVRTLSLVLAVCLWTEVGATGPQVTGVARRFSTVTAGAGEDANTTSTTLVPMPGMLLEVRTLSSGPILISFCGKTLPGTPTPEILLVEAWVDGVPATEPRGVPLDAGMIGQPTWYTTHCFNFVAPQGSRGRHQIQMMFKSLEGVEVSIQERSLTAFYN
jgi:hypothetical protein